MFLGPGTLLRRILQSGCIGRGNAVAAWRSKPAVIAPTPSVPEAAGAALPAGVLESPGMFFTIARIAGGTPRPASHCCILSSGTASPPVPRLAARQRAAPAAGTEREEPTTLPSA